MADTFFPVLGWTLIWATLATVTCFFFGILLALLINTKGLKFKGVWRTIFVITMAVPQFISLLVMRNLLNGAGPINATLLSLGLIDSAIPFLTDPIWAKITVIVVNMWIGIPATMLVSTGIIQNLPTDQIEAARIDGANKLQIFRNITFPQILFVMMPALIQHSSAHQQLQRHFPVDRRRPIEFRFLRSGFDGLAGYLAVQLDGQHDGLQLGVRHRHPDLHPVRSFQSACLHKNEFIQGGLKKWQKQRKQQDTKRSGGIRWLQSTPSWLYCRSFGCSLSCGSF
jgi:ABC-type amino acid transport system permease subunit